MAEVKKEDGQVGGQVQHEEITAKSSSGMAMLIVNIILYLGSIFGFIWGIFQMVNDTAYELGLFIVIVTSIYFVVGIFLFCGLRILKPNEALVLTLFGKYHGTLKGDGFFFVNPFVSSTNPTAGTISTATGTVSETTQSATVNALAASGIALGVSKKISLKNMTLNNDKQKVNDQLGNPIVVGTVVIWRVVNTAKAVFAVDNYKEFLSTQCDAALRNIVRLYPYDVSDGDSEKSLRGSGQEIAEKLKCEIQEKVDVAGLEIIEAKITRLSYAPEIAAAMLQRQQASAIVDAKALIVEGAVGLVQMALKKLSEQKVVELDEERKAAMVSNLLVVLCGSKDATPVVNSGTLY